MQDGRGGSENLHNLPSLIPVVSTNLTLGRVSAFSAAGLVGATGAATFAGSVFGTSTRKHARQSAIKKGGERPLTCISFGIQSCCP
jgi:hypothetical protein